MCTTDGHNGTARFVCRFVECGHIGAPVRRTRPPEPERKTIAEKALGDIDCAATARRRIRQPSHDGVGHSSQY